MFYYMYQIKNKVNGKIYVGVHKTSNINDGYMGSGKVIRAAINKHGIENFEKTILETFANSEEMFKREKEVVTEDFLSRDDVYNLRRGGLGGFDHINKQGLQRIARVNTNKTLEQKYGADFLSILGKKGTSKQKVNGQLAQSIDRLRNYPGFKSESQKNNALAKANNEESIRKKKETWKSTARGQGKNNSQYGTAWITDGTNNKKIIKTDPLPTGWKYGRISCPGPAN